MLWHLFNEVCQCSIISALLFVYHSSKLTWLQWKGTHTHTCIHANCLQIHLILGVSALYCALFFFSFVSLSHRHPHTHAHTGSSYEDRVFWLCLNLLYALMNVSEATVNAASRENKLVFFCFTFLLLMEVAQLWTCCSNTLLYLLCV